MVQARFIFIYATTLLLFLLISLVDSFVPPTLSTSSSSSHRLASTKIATAAATIPSSLDVRDKMAIEATRKAMDRPRDTSFPLIELEFPPLEQLNKLGDGSLRSALDVDDANLKFVGKLVKNISFSMMINPFFTPIKQICLVLSSSATNSIRSKAEKIVQGESKVTVVDASSSSLLLSNDSENKNDGIVYIFVSPSSRKDYMTAQQLAQQQQQQQSKSNAVHSVIIVNGFAKNPDSVSGFATMSFYYKPLTYNSQLAGYVIRSYPSLWTVLDATTQQVLQTYTDEEILFLNSNTPDLRSSTRLVQKSVDARAIAARG